MVASGVAVDAGRAAELAHPDDGRVRQQPALLQILDQRAHRPIHLGQLVVLERREDVLVVVPAAEIHFDERHTLFDQPAGHQAAAAEVILAVALADRRRFLTATLKASICLLVIR